MTEVVDTFEDLTVKKFRQGPERDNSVEIYDAVKSLMDSMPQAFVDWLDSQDPFTRKSIIEQLEEVFTDELNLATNIGEEDERYRKQYEEWGWQYDETSRQLSTDIMQTPRYKELNRVANVLHSLKVQKIEVSDES